MHKKAEILGECSMLENEVSDCEAVDISVPLQELFERCLSYISVNDFQ